MNNKPKNEKICVICGKPFYCPPSSKKITCSKECSTIRKTKSHIGKHNVWTEESKRKLSQRGQTDNLKMGTEAAKRSCNSGRFETNVNAIDWHLVSPDGKHYYFHSLNYWLRENCCELFGIEPDSREFENVRSGLSSAKRAVMGGSYMSTTYKEWRVIPTENDYKTHNKS